MRRFDDILIDNVFQPVSDRAQLRYGWSCFGLARATLCFFVICNLLGFYFGATLIYATKDPAAVIFTAIYAVAAWRSIDRAEHFATVLGDNPQRIRAMSVRMVLVFLGLVFLCVTFFYQEAESASTIMFLCMLWFFLLGTEYFMSCLPFIADLGRQP